MYVAVTFRFWCDPVHSILRGDFCMTDFFMQLCVYRFCFFSVIFYMFVLSFTMCLIYFLLCFLCFFMQ